MCTNSNKYLSSIKEEVAAEGSNLYDFGIATNENSVFLVATDSDGKQVQSINFDGVSDLADAKAKEWTILGYLEYNVLQKVVQFYSAVTNI